MLSAMCYALTVIEVKEEFPPLWTVKLKISVKRLKPQTSPQPLVALQ